MTKLLVESGAALLKPKKDGITILHSAASFNDIHILDYAIRVKDTKTIDLQNNDVLSSKFKDLGLHPGSLCSLPW